MPIFSKESKLFDIADSQQGYFTAKQAVDCGFSQKNHHYYVKIGQWTQELRGIYRLVNYPVTERPDLMLWYLWSRNQEDIPQGVYSYETALSLYDICDIMPAKVHMTVPHSFRRNSRIPKILIIYKENLISDDITSYQGFKITKPIRTLIDIINKNTLSNDFIEQAITEAFNKGLVISRESFLTHPLANSSLVLKKKIEEYLR